GHALPLPEPPCGTDTLDRGIARSAEGGAADLCAGNPDQDVPALLPGRVDGEDAGLGRGRVRRLHAKLKLKNTAVCFSASRPFSIQHHVALSAGFVLCAPHAW